MVIVASTTADYVENVARAAIAAGADYLDIHYPQNSVPILKKLAAEIEAAERCFITQAGFCPGLPAVLARLAARHFTVYEKARVGVAMNTRFERGEALDEFMDSMADYGADVFADGRWRRAGPRDVVRIDFGGQFGKKQCYPMNLEEMWALPEMLGLKRAGDLCSGNELVCGLSGDPGRICPGQDSKRPGQISVVEPDGLGAGAILASR